MANMKKLLFIYDFLIIFIIFGGITNFYCFFFSLLKFDEFVLKINLN
jgi:hypothetical protein